LYNGRIIVRRKLIIELNMRNFIFKYTVLFSSCTYGLIFRSPKELAGHAQEDQPVLPSVSVAVFSQLSFHAAMPGRICIYSSFSY
jgi:hypothetical protein